MPASRMAEPAMRTRKAACGLRIRISLRSSRVTPLSPAGEPKLIATRERGVEAETVPRSRSMGLDPLAVHERFVADHLDQDRSMAAVPNPAPHAIAAQRQGGLELLAGSEHNIGLKRRRCRQRRRRAHERQTKPAATGSEPRPESAHPAGQVNRARAVGVAKVVVAHLNLLRNEYCTEIQYYLQGAMARGMRSKQAGKARPRNPVQASCCRAHAATNRRRLRIKLTDATRSCPRGQKELPMKQRPRIVAAPDLH